MSFFLLSTTRVYHIAGLTFFPSCYNRDLPHCLKNITYP
ncbi:hypothetical protein C1G86_1001 [Dehalococcoides mccartyi]|uniref:Uncharacterized protein n=1 Tax=Dehalococcoides mccartyi TaxID=61435 RepID=A0A328ESU2_9CHLR|nr:hypothetical protein C1G87_0972 [Dehalococcoides mccartyi]RAL70451.1 hypothetical protein C1G86_1001 [Dehalococcoides mccartyi]